MKPRSFRMSLTWVFLLLLSLNAASGDEVNYFYDDAGRLTRVLSGTESAIYQYDEVGNLLSIFRGAISQSPPLVNSISSDVLFLDSTIKVNIVGENLLTTSEITSDNSSLIIKTLSVTDSTLTLSITVPSNASVGAYNILVNTLYGSAQTGIVITRISFTPSHLAIGPGISGSITANLSPSVGKEVSITLKNSDSTVISTVQTITIPSSGSMIFTVNALTEGAANISLSVSDSLANCAVIFVSNPFTPEPGESVTSSAKPVSVIILPSKLVDVTRVTLPVSVYIQPSLSLDLTPVTLPVSVYIQPSLAVDVTPVTLPVSVYIQPSLAVDVAPVTLPISVYIQPSSAVDVTPVTSPISVFIQPLTAPDTTSVSPPISISIGQSSIVDAVTVSEPVSVKINQ